MFSKDEQYEPASKVKVGQSVYVREDLADKRIKEILEFISDCKVVLNKYAVKPEESVAKTLDDKLAILQEYKKIGSVRELFELKELSTKLNEATNLRAIKELEGVREYILPSSSNATELHFACNVYDNYIKSRLNKLRGNV